MATVLQDRVIPYQDIKPGQRVVFMHIPKAAGTSFRVTLEEVYGDKFFNIAPFIPQTWEPYKPKGFNQFEALAGHFSINSEIYRMFDGPFVSLVTLRHPTNRVLSAYNYILNHPNHHQHAMIAGRGLADIYRDGEAYRFMMKDLQVQALSGSLRPTEQDLQKAKDNLKNSFSFFGLVEQFEMFMDICNKKLGWNAEQKFNNRGVYDKAVFSIRELIEEHNQLDIALYSYAHKLQQERIEGGFYG